MKKRKVLIISSILSVSIFTSACSPSQANLEDRIKDKLNIADETIIEDYTGVNHPIFTNYKLLYAELEQEDATTNLNLYGLAKLSSGKTAYTNIGYKLPVNCYISNLTLDTIKDIITNYDINSVKVHEVNNHLALNDTVDNLTKPDKQNYYKENAMVYDISLPEIDELRGVAVFYTKSYVSTFKIPENITPDFVPSEETTTYDKYSVTNKVYVRISPSEVEYLKQNPQMIYDRFTQAVEKHQDDLYSITNLEIERLTNEQYLHQENITTKQEQDLER